MAVATPESAAAVSVEGSRWTAVSASFEGEEATISIEEEMQKAYAAYAAYVPAESDSAGVAAVPEVEAATAGIHQRLRRWSKPRLPRIFLHRRLSLLRQTATISPAVFAEPDPTAVPVAEPVNSVVRHPAGLVAQEAPEAQASQPQELQRVPEAQPVLAETAAASQWGRCSQRRWCRTRSGRQANSDAVRSTAAAWASWRQIRDSGKDGEAAPVESREFEVSEPVPAETPMAVAAGAEQIAQEASAAPKGDSAEVASIVESVLANFAPS